MHSKSTFFIISCINSTHTVYTPDDRFRQTLESIASVRRYAPGCNIVFLDGSTTPLEGNTAEILASQVDHYLEYTPDLFTKHVNSTGRNKGLNELLAYDLALRWTLGAGISGRRIFKLSGRYTLDSRFNLDEYNKLCYTGRYVFRPTPWVYNDGAGEYTKIFYNTALWSMCSSLAVDYLELAQVMFSWMMNSGENIEMAHNYWIPKDKLLLVDEVGGSGYITNGQLTKF